MGAAANASATLDAGGLSTAEQQLRSEAEGVQQQAAELKRLASEQAAASLESAKANLKEAAQKTTRYGQSLIEEQKSRLAEIIHEYSHAAQAASENLHQEGHSALADRATEVASRFDRISRYLQERKPAESTATPNNLRADAQRSFLEWRSQRGF